MRIVFFTLLKQRPWGGSENLWFKTAIYALENGHKILIVCEKDIMPENIQVLKNLGADIFILENHLTKYYDRFIQYFDSSYSSVKFTNQLNLKINEFNADLLVINQPGCYDIAFNETIFNFLKLTTIKYVVCSHSYVENLVLEHSKIELMNVILQKAQACFFVAKKQVETIMMQLKVNLNNVAYIFNPLNLSSDAYIPYPTLDEVNLAMVGSLDMNWKGHDIIINILSKPHWTKKKWKLNIFGSGPDFDEINELIKKHDLSDRIVLKGQKKDIREIWIDHHILIMPSRVDAAPSVLLEAMACGRTAVCTNIGFVENWIEDNVNGFISPESEITTFESTLINAWGKINSWQEMGILASNKIKSNLPKQPEKYFLDQLFDL
jgi:glycosyltransferase involved in cell wall biosynthesis